MKYIYYFFLIFFFPQILFSQTINDSLLTNVIKISNDDIVKIDKQYLIDIPIQFSENETAVFFNNSTILNQFILQSRSFYPQLKEFILISPDWKYYKEVEQSATENEIECAEPIPTNWYYQIKRERDTVIVDSIRLQGKKMPQLQFKKIEPLDNTIVYYSSESYGSKCCPRSFTHSLKKKFNNLVTTFKTENNIPLLGAYRQIEGKEGEHSIFYTLEKLTIEQKLQFIIKHVNVLFPKEKNKPKIYTPKIKEKNSRLKLLQY